MGGYIQYFDEVQHTSTLKNMLLTSTPSTNMKAQLEESVRMTFHLKSKSTFSRRKSFLFPSLIIHQGMAFTEMDEGCEGEVFGVIHDPTIDENI